MTVANVNVTKVLLKRGNTAQNNNYTGVSGELTIDTQAATLRIHDGSTQGGTVITAGGAVGSYSNTNTAAYLTSQNITSANIGGSQLFANTNAAVQATAINSLNANVGAFQSYANLTYSTIANASSQESAIDSLRANITAANTAITSLTSNASSQESAIDSLRANITAANTAIIGLTSNAAIQAAILDTLTGNAATQSTVLDTLTSNAATQAITLTTLLANAVNQETSLISLLGNAATQDNLINSKANLSGAVFSGNVQANYILANNQIETETFIRVGPAHDQGQTWANPGALFFGNTSGQASTYYQINLQNVDPIGSGDLVLTADDGNDGSNFINLGINNSQYSDIAWPNSFPHDGYLYITGGNLYLSTESKDILFTTNASNASETAITKFSANGTWYFGSNILPAANVTYSLGSSTHQWKDLWVSNNTIYIGNTPIRVDGTTLLINGAPVSGNSYSNTNVAAYLLGNITTGNIKSGNLAAIGDIVTNVRHWESAGANLYIWFDAASKPDVVAIGAFGNIVGWTVSVSDGNSATVTATNPAGYFSISTDVSLTGSGNLTFTSPGYQGETPAPITISSGSNTWAFGTDGTTTLPGGGSIDGSDYDVDIIAGNDGVGTFGHISFTANGPNGLNSLTYNSLGEITVVTAGANDGLIKWVGNSSGDGAGYTTMTMVPDTTREGTDQYIIIDPTGGEPGHIHIRAGGTQDSSAADLYLGGELTAVRVSDTSGIVTVRTTNIGDPNITMDWSFQPDGNLYFPGIGNNRIGESEPGLVVTSDNSVVLQSNNSGNIGEIKEWYFGTDGSLTLPTGGNLIFDNSSTSIIDGVTDINAVGTIGANVIQVLSDLTSFGASPAPRIYGFSSIATTGSAVNEGNISASGNLVTGRNAYVTGNVFAAQYNFANGVNILDTITGVTSISSVVNTSIWSDASGDYQYGTLDYSYAVNGNNGQFAIQYSFPLVYGNVDVNVGNVIASNVTTTNGIFWANGQAYSTGGGSYGNTEVAAYLPAYTGNLGAGRAQVTNAVDFMYGGFPYMGWQLSGSDTLKLRTNIASGDYTNDAIIVDRQSLAVNVVATLTAGNIVTTNGLFWSNGVAYSSGGAASTGNITFSDTTISTAGGAGQGIILNSAGSGEIAMLDYVGLNNTNPGYWLHIGDGAPGAVNNTGNISIDYNNGLDSSRASTIIGYAWWDAGGNGNNNRGIGAHRQFGIYKNDDLYTTKYLEIDLNSGNANLTNIAVSRVTTTNGVFWANGVAFSTGGSTYSNTEVAAYLLTYPNANFATLNTTSANITTVRAANFNTANAVITGGYATGLANISVTGNVTVGNLIGTSSNTTIVAGNYSSTFDTVGNVVLPSAFVSGNATVMGIAPGYAPNRPAFRIYGSSSNNWTTSNINFKGSDIVVDYNQGNYFNSTTGVFTAPVAGLYSITLNARIGNNNGQNQIMVLKNGLTSAGNVAVMWESDTNTGTAVHYGVSSVMKLVAGDFLTANITVGNVQFDANDSWTVTYLG